MSFRLINLKNNDDIFKQILTDEICPNCGKKIKLNILNVLGRERRIKQTCKCITDKYHENKKREEEYEKKIRFEKLCKQSCLGEKFKNAKFDTIKITEHNKQIIESLKLFCLNFNENKNKSFLIFSHPGTGKTLITSAVVNMLVKQNKSVIFKNIIDILDQIKSSYGNYNDGIDEIKLIHGLCKTELLVLDDLGSENITNWSQEKIFKIIDKRYTDSRSTIFTTNLSLNEIKATYEDRIFSRLIEMTKNNIFDLNNEKDWRLY
jgi:DNA replication protein DnaC